MDAVFEALGNGIGSAVTLLADSGVLFAVFALAWIAFGVALLGSQRTVDRAWARVRSLPLLLQALAWLLFLPVMVGLWIWESTWPIVVRATLLLGLAGWNLVMFLPRALQTPVP